jgi:heme exporter protein B
VKSKSNLLGNAYYIFLKDLRLEFRTRYAINAIILFAITTLIAISFSIGPINLRSEVLSPLLWIILFFSSMSGLSHIFVREEEAMMGVLVGNVSAFLIILIIGSIGLSSVATIIAAIIAQASAKGTLFAVLAFPISVPILISGINGTSLAMDGEQFSGCLADLQILFSFSIVIITLSLLLFEFIWRK